MPDDVAAYADEHESGQLRLGVAGEQVSLLGLPDSAIPTMDEPQAVDELPDALIPSPRQIRALSDEELRPFVDEIMRFSEPTRKAIAGEANKRAAARRQAGPEPPTIHKQELRRSFSANRGHRFAVVLVFTDGAEKVLHEGPSYVDACRYRVSEADCVPPL